MLLRYLVVSVEIVNTRVLLIAPSLLAYDSNSYSDVDEGYPLGVAYLHSYLESCDIEVKTLDCRFVGGVQQQQITLSAIEEFKPNLVGFHVMTPNRFEVIELADLIASQNDDILVVLGGPHIEACGLQLIKHRPNFVAVLGDGELTLLRLVNAIDIGASLEGIPGLILSLDGKVISTGTGELIQDLDQLPFPKHETFLNGNSIYASLMTSRGCPFACSFCAVARKKPRLRSIENVLEEISYIEDNFPNVKIVRIWDDQFFFQPKRVIELCDRLYEKKSRLKFTCLARLKPFDSKLLDALERGGFVEIGFGLETGSDYVSKINNKGIVPTTDAIKCVEVMANSRIRVFMFLIVGLPGESRKTLSDTKKLCRKLLKIRFIHFQSCIGIATIYPGTQLERLAIENKLMEDDYWVNDNGTPYYTVEHSYNTLEHMRIELEENLTLQQEIYRQHQVNLNNTIVRNYLLYVTEHWSTFSTPHCDITLFSKDINVMANTLRSLDSKNLMYATVSSQLRKELSANRSVKNVGIHRVPDRDSCFEMTLVNVHKLQGNLNKSNIVSYLFGWVLRNGSENESRLLIEEFVLETKKAGNNPVQVQNFYRGESRFG